MDVYPRFGPTSEWDTAAGAMRARSRRRRGARSARPAAALQPARHAAQRRFHRARRSVAAVARLAVSACSERATSTSCCAIMARLRDPERGCPWDVAAGLRHDRAVHDRGSLRSRRRDRPRRHGATCATSSATCCCRSCSMRAWPRSRARSISPTWSPRSATRWCAGIRTCSPMPTVATDAEAQTARLGRAQARANAQAAGDADASRARRHLARHAGMAARGEAADSAPRASVSTGPAPRR